MLRLIAASILLFMPGLALAQGGNCVTGSLLRVDAAFSRHGAGGTFDYSVQITNVSTRPVTFRVSFRMTNAQPNPLNFSTTYNLPPNGNRIVLLGSGTEISTSSRIGGGVQLNC